MSGELSRDLPGSMDVDEDEAMQTEIELSRLIEHCILTERSQQADESGLKTESIAEKPEDLPKSLIATNLPRCVFQDLAIKREFEDLFMGYDNTATFHYLKSFRRARIDFTSPSATAADAARIHLHQSVFAGSPINVYFAQPIILKSATAQQAYLQLPPPVRQFLISPPASPPVDWAPGPESEPIINYDLLAALAKLGPGEAHELHPSSESHPSIVVHVCGEEVDDSLTGGGGKIAPTKCPQRK